MDGKKEYVIKINGVSEGVTDVTKLEDAVNSLDGAIQKVNATGVTAAKTSKDRKAALTDEEKAAQKLADTQKKIDTANSDANRAQIEATQQLRERTREVTRQIQIEKLAEGSIKRIGMELHDMREAYKAASPEQREYLESIGKGITRIQALDAQYKGLKESVGQYQDSVGNYGKALDGLDKFSAGVENTTKTTMGLAQSLLGANVLLGLFGNQSDEDAARAQKLQKIIALLSIAQQVNTNVLKQGIVQSKAAAVMDAVRITQIKVKTAAEAASTKGTIAATVAQKIFNAVASANPYVLLAMALIAVGTALFAFANKTDDAAKKQQELNEKQQAYIEKLKEEDRLATENSNRRVVDLERQLRVLNSENVERGKEAEHLKAVRDLENRIAAERKTHNEYLRGKHAEEYANMEKNTELLGKYRASLEKIQDLQRNGSEAIVWDIEYDGKKIEYTTEEALKLAQQKVDEYEYKVMIPVELDTQAADNAANDQITANNREKEDKERAKTAAEAAKKRAETELNVTRAAEDARVKLIQNTDEQARRTLENSYNRQIEDIRRRLSTETDLAVKARTALNDQIVSLEKQKGVDVERLQKEQAARALVLQQEVEDSRLALIVGAFDRQYAETNIQHDRQIEAYKKRLEEDKTLTEDQQAEITELILNAQTARGNALSKLLADQTAERADLELSAVEDALEAAQNKIGETLVRDKSNKWEFIDVDATRENLAAANSALGEYILDLQSYLTTLKTAHEDTLATMQEGSTEYEAEQQAYARTVENITKRIKDAQREQQENTKASADVQTEAYRDMFEKIAAIAQEAAATIGQAAETFNMALSAQVEDLNAQLEAINERYEEAQKQHEDAAERVEDLEAQMRDATGSTAEALKEQLQDAMHARNEAAREEKRIAKEKERTEAEIAKKEKQMKRADLIANIAVGVANVAQAVTKAWAQGGFTLGAVFAGITAALGAVQVGIMTNQLAKLKDGGEIKGPSHANGGVPIKVNGAYAYEAQGGEFMVNDRAYRANKPLVNFINTTERALTVADLAGIIPGDTTPLIVTDVAPSSEDRIIEAIDGINIRPVVSVTDINDANDTLTTVTDLAGF